MDVILVLFLSVIGDVETIVCVYRHRSACTGRNHASGGPSIGADRDISCKICRLVRGIGKLDARYTASAAIDRKCILGCETRSPVGPGEDRRSAERRVRTEWGSTVTTRWAPEHEKKKTNSKEDEKD